MTTGKLFLGNLPYSVDDERLRTELARLGVACDLVEVVRDRATGRSRGFAFAHLGEAESTVEAVRKLEGFSLDGRPTKVDDASQNHPGPGRRPPRISRPLGKPDRRKSRRRRDAVTAHPSSFGAAWEDD